MKPIEFGAQYAAPRDRVFEVFMDVPCMSERIEAITKIEVLTDGPIGEGTRFRETRLMGKKERSEVLEIQNVKDGESYEVVCDSCGCLMECQFTFEDCDGGTKMRMSMQATPQSLFAKIVTPLMMPLMRKMMIKCMSKDFDDVRSVIESRGEPVAQPV
jgi:hypothetical protein